MNKKIWEQYPELIKSVRDAHIEFGLFGSHNFDHALRVGQMAYILAMSDNPTFAEQAGVAGLLHNNDRILECKLGIKFQNISSVPDLEIKKFTSSFLTKYTTFSENEKELIIQAVISHGTKPNQPNEHIIVTAVADADRLINMEPDAIIRGSQNHPENPALDPIHIEASPDSSYADMKTIIWGINNAAHWMDETGPYIIRLPMARKLGKERSEYLFKFIEIIKRQRRELGLLPYPKELWQSHEK